MARRMSASFPLVLALLATASVAAAQNGGTSPRLVTVNMVNVSATHYAFQPSQIAVHQGDTLRFVQTGAMPHNVQFVRSPVGTNLGAAQMGPFLTAAGQHYDLVIDGRFAIGVHDIVCTPHVSMGMTGSITVSGPIVGTR